MAAPKLGEASKALVDNMREGWADHEITKEHAAAIFGGAKAVTIGEMTDIQILQYLLLSAHVEIERLAQLIQKAPQGPNRAQRRAKKK